MSSESSKPSTPSSSTPASRPATGSRPAGTGAPAGRPSTGARPGGFRPGGAPRPGGAGPRRPGGPGGRPGGRFRGRPPMRRKVCRFCVDKIKDIDYKAVHILRGFMTPRGKILGGRTTGTCAKCQRRLASAIKRAQFLALLPYTGE